MLLKKSKNYDEQVQILESKGLEISDKDAVIAFLNRVNYYRFSGYFLAFISKSDKKFRNKTTFEQLKNIYYFDAELRDLIMGAIDEIEIYLKSQISYYHSQKYDAEGYLDTLNFNKYHNHSRFMKHVNTCINENQRTLVVKHHIANYDGHFPIWVLIEYFSIGMLSYFYRDLRSDFRFRQNVFAREGGLEKNRFIEDGRELFLLYLKPIINGTGNYYIEAQTRDQRRTDVIIDYLGQRYIIEMKIWRGERYNTEGEKQICEYLDYYGLNTGYMLSFNFNAKKETGVKRVLIGDKVLFEGTV